MSSKRSLYLLPEELKNALIVDSQGYIYGRVREVRVESDRISLVASVRVDIGDEYIDEGRLRELLASRGFNVKELSTHELISIAREQKIAIPKTEAERTEDVIKGVISVDEIVWIDRWLNDYVILLSTPREARYRGIREVKHPLYTDVKGKLALSLSQGVLGIVVGIAIGPGEVALRISPSPSMVNWLRFISEIRKRGYRELEEKLSDLIDPYKNPKISMDKLSLVNRIIEKAPEEINTILNSCIEWGNYIHIPWKNILRVGDIVIVK